MAEKSTVQCNADDKTFLLNTARNLDWALPKRDYETVAGLVLATLHRIPRRGEVFQVDGYTITVLEADERHVTAVKITPPPAPGPQFTA